MISDKQTAAEEEIHTILNTYVILGPQYLKFVKYNNFQTKVSLQS